MGWNLWFELKYEKEPAYWVMLPRLLDAMLASDLFTFHEMFIIDTKSIHKQGRMVENSLEHVKAEDTDKQPLVQTLERWMREYVGPGLYVEITLFAPRRWREDDKLPEQTSVYLVGYDKHFPMFLRDLSGVMYDARNKNLFFPTYEQTETPKHTENLTYLLAELEVFAKAGITDMYGLFNEGDDYPNGLRSWHVCYHQDIGGFIADMNTQKDTDFLSDNFTVQDLQEVVDSTPYYDCKEMSNGYIVWSIEGTRRAFNEFHTALHDWCKRNLLTKFEDKIYATWAKHIGLPKEDLRKRGYHIERLEDLDGTQTVQLFKLGHFAYLRCDAQLYDLLTEAVGQLIADDTVQDVSGDDLQGVLTQKRLDYDHIERVFYLHPDDFMPVPDSDLPIRALTEADTPALELLKTQCTEEEFEDSWVSATDELSFGAFDGDRLVACASMYQLWGFADPGVLVDPAYRKRRLGVAVVSKICEQVIADGLIMNYRCTVDNIASMKLATRLGFKQHFVIEVFKITDV